MNEEFSCRNRNMYIEDVNNLDEVSLKGIHITTSEKNTGDSEDDTDIKFAKTRPKFKRFTESDSDTDKENDLKNSSPQKSDSDECSSREVHSFKKKSRIRNISDSESESLSGNDNNKEKNKYDLTRTKIRNNELHDKFKQLKNSKSVCKDNNDKLEVSLEETNGEYSDDSSEDGISCSKIKQKLKKKTSKSLAAICDPDTSDDEATVKVKVQKSKPRSTKLISPKPERMSAKQAMENRQKIKSESNRMLREKEVSLPYHRPKALTLKDIMNRRKPALTSDGKSLPIKMNNDQLKQYALHLEQRQKEMMELCKSESEEEEDHNCQEEQPAVDKSTDDNENMDNIKLLNQEDSELTIASDKIHDNVNMECSENPYNNLNNQSTKDAIVVSEIHDKKPCEESVEIYQEYVMNEISEEKQEQAMEVSISQETIALSSNVLNQDTKKSTEKEDQIMDVISNNKVLILNEVNKETEEEGQIISLHYDSEKTEVTDSQNIVEFESTDKIKDISSEISMTNKEKCDKKLNDEFSDNDFTMEELEEIIGNAESNKDSPNKPLPTFEAAIEIKPMLTGTPGMVIDLDDNIENTQKKLTGVELLKERFKYFARLKSLEDMEKDREKKFKPGIQHLQLKQKLEEQIAEQRSLEWEKRLQAEAQLKTEINGNETEEFDGDDIEKIEAKLEENGIIEEEEESSSEEEIDDIEDCNIKDKPRIRNPLIDDEAEVSEDENEDLKKVSDLDGNKEGTDTDDNDAGDHNEDDDGETDSEDNDDEESSESEEEEQQNKCRKGRILKAFEDSDDDESKVKLDNASQPNNHEFGESQDDEIQLAQPQKTYSSDLFASQDCSQKTENMTDGSKVVGEGLEYLGTQTFSILNSGTETISGNVSENVTSEKVDVICETQPSSDDNFDGVAGMCTAGFTENLVTPQSETSQLSQSQDIGDDVAELCTGKFYNNPFVSQTIGDGEIDIENKTEHKSITESNEDTEKQTGELNKHEKLNGPKPTRLHEGENKLLKSILDELDDPEFDSPKPNKYFFNVTKNKDEDKTKIENTQFKKKFVIESDDETSTGAELSNKKKKRKKRKLENRALQISDDEEEEEEYSEPDQEGYESEIEEDDNKLVEYDSEENEVEVQAKAPKKKRVGNDFFEQEAELTSEDEWIGSGDEDEAGLDRMEREEGDDDTFHQGKLQRELGEIHIREVLDQDKREVRLLQELLFEDGDLGDGHRQRKFRWKNADGEEESGTNVDEYADTQEDEFESEEQWRKQRHEREMFLRKMDEKDDDANVSINRSAFIKATLASKPTSNTTLEKISIVDKQTNLENTKPHESTEKKTANNIPSPKKPFILLQQNYHNSLLTRGRGALARLAALATPLAGDGDDTPKVNASSNRGNFVFAAITPGTGSKVIKRKADTAPDTPRLLKKLKQESKINSKSSLLDHL